MKRVLMILATIGILCVAVGQVQAHGYHHGPRGYYYRGCGPVMVHPPVFVAPRVVMPPPVYPPVYRYRPYYPAPAYGFYYQGRGLSIGVGF